MKTGYPKAPLQNGLGRYVCQLKRVVIKFCKTTGHSKGIREFIENDLLDFARANPGIVVYVKPRRFRGPCLWAEYLNGGEEYIGISKMSRDEIAKWLNYLRTRPGVPEMKYLKMWHTDTPSIQGVWSPFTHRDPALNLVEFPQESLSQPVNQTQTATQMLIEMFKKTNIQDESSEKETESAESVNKEETKSS